MVRSALKWIDGTDFGYYALCPEPYVASWDGTEAGEACDEYAARVDLPGHGDVLVLGGEPLPATYFAEHLTFARWYTAEDDLGLARAVERAMDSDGWEDACEVSLDGDYRLMDCLVAGEDVTEADSIRVRVPEGRYLVRSLFLDVSPEEQFMLERLVRL